jgi:tetratricopeptide (TPR) repeat protein
LPPGLAQAACPACLFRAGLEKESELPPGPLDSPGTADHQGATGFERSDMGTVLESLADSIGAIPRVLLPDTDDASVAVIQPSSIEMPALADRGHRYQLFGEIARGGMGAVLKGRDADLGRDLAVKVLLEQHLGKPDLARRFVEEAQIGGQLQHPGIVPVYELGTFADRRPYFTMKLVKGRTLASLLSERTDPRADLPRSLGIFAQVAQTVAYAHARCVIHRDLKPSNVMVGSFGEVQLMDWGLAKVLKEGGIADEEPRHAPADELEVSVIRTVRSGSANDQSQAGSVLGTPAYMAPEQAGGDVARVDRRADVFGLGSILCEILTGQPAYTGRNNNEIMRRALRGDTSDACARLTACGVDVELVALARECLAPEPADRPRDAGAVASRITAYLAGVQEKLHTAERERAVAEARAVEERRRRKLQVGLAAAVLALTTVGGLSTSYYLRQKQARAAAMDRVFAEATTLRDQARDHADDPARWQAALAAVRRLDDLLDGGRGSAGETRGQLATLRAEVAAGSDGAVRDRRLLDHLVDIRSAKADDPDGSATDAAYTDAFKERGIDVAALPPAVAGEQIKARPAATAQALAVALDDWAAVRWRRRADRTGAQRLAEAARVADDDPWRRDLRAALYQTDRSARLTALQAAARSARFDTLGAVSLDLLGTALESLGDPATAETVLRAAQRRHPDDVWINYDLADLCEKRNRREDAVRFYTAARSIRPETAHQLAHLLEDEGESDEAVAVFHDLARLRPRNAVHLACLGRLLKELGQPEEAGQFLDAAVATAREAIRLKPDDAPAHGSLANALSAQGKFDEAIAESRAAIRLKPDEAGAHANLGLILSNSKHDHDGAIAEFRTAIRLRPDAAIPRISLGNALKAQGKLDEAISEYREVIRLKPDDPFAHNNLGATLCDGKHDYDGAIAEFRAAIRLRPDHAAAHHGLGNALKAQGKLDEAIAEYHEAIRLKPDNARAHDSLANGLADQGKLDEAVAEYHEAIRLEPDDANAHYNLGVALRSQAKIDEAIAEFRAAIELKPDYAMAHTNLGSILWDRKHDHDGAIAEFRTAIRLDPHFASAHDKLGVALGRQGKQDEAIAEFHTAIRIQPDFAPAHNNLAVALNAQGKLDEAIAEYREAIRLQPELAAAHGNLGIALKAQGKLDEAIAEYREAIRLQPDDGGVHNNLGIALKAQGKRDLAAAEHREAIRLQPDNAEAHNNLGLILYDQSKLDEAAAEYREAIRLKPDYANAHHNLGLALSAQRRLRDAVAEYYEAIRLKPDDAIAHFSLGIALKAQGKLDEAVAEYHEAIRLKPDDAAVHFNLGNALKAQAKLDEAVAEYHEAIRLKPDDAGAHDNLGLALRAQGKFDEAIAEYQAAIRLKSDDSIAHNNLGGILCDIKHDYDGAVAEFRAVIRLNPDDAFAHFNLGNALRGQRKPDEAIAEYREAIQIKPDYAEAHNSLGNALKAQGKLDEAIAEFRAATRLRPDDFGTRLNLAGALNAQGKLDEAVAEYRELIRLNPNSAATHTNLGNALKAQGKLDEAIAEYRVVTRLKPDDASAHNNLGAILCDQKHDYDGAIAEFREALRLQPDDARVHHNLGIALKAQGRLDEALVAFRRAAALAKPGSPLARGMPGTIRQTEQMIALAGRLPALLKGEDGPRDAAELETFVRLCRNEGRYGAAARLLAGALAADPKLGDDRRTQHRYNAACSAALAGCGKSSDDPPPDGPARATLRQQALDWLKAERAAWAQVLETGVPRSGALIIQKLRHWQQDPDLAGVRDPDDLARLPEEEQTAWRELWLGVATLLKKADVALPPRPPVP